jgi:hypothetical protein
MPDMKILEQPALGGDLGPYLYVSWDKEGLPDEVILGGGLTMEGHLREVADRLGSLSVDLEEEADYGVAHDEDA